MDEQEEAHCIICKLRVKPFNRHSFPEKLKIIQDGAPKPPLPELRSTHEDKKGKYIRNFQITQYKLHSWMCGCDKKNQNRLYCWPCILFSKTKNIWNSDGASNLNSLGHIQKKHKHSSVHLQSCLDIENFNTQERIGHQFDTQIRGSVIIHNQMVKKNREIMKRLIDLTCTLGRQGLPFRGHNEKEDPVNRGHYIEFLNFLKIYDPLIEDHLTNSTMFNGTSADIQNDLIHCVAHVIRDKILEEIKTTSYVAIMLDETSDIQSVSQLSTVFRYVNKNQIVERFIGFTDVSAERTASTLFKHVESVVDKYDFEKKIMGQTYDGAVVMNGEFNGLKNKILDKYPTAMHVHCYAHASNLILSQSLTFIKQCNIFFSTLNGISMFASNSSKRAFSLKQYLKRKILSLAPTKWSFTSTLVNVIKEYRLTVIQYFRDIADDLKNWNAVDRNTASGFKRFLKKFNTIFLLEVLAPIFSRSDLLFAALRSPAIDIAQCSKKIEDFINFLKNEKNIGFKKAWNNTQKRCDEEYKPAKKQARQNGNERKQLYKTLFFEIIDNIENQIVNRFESFKHLDYFSLLDTNKFENFKNTFPDEILKNLCKNYGNIFNFVKLKNELFVCYSNNNFKNKSIYDILQWFTTEFRIDSFNEIYKLASLMCTVPATAASVERNFSALRRVKMYSRSIQLQNRLSNLPIMNIENELLTELRSNTDFYDKVINKFVKTSRRIELDYK